MSSWNSTTHWFGSVHKRQGWSISACHSKRDGQEELLFWLVDYGS